MRIAMVTHDYYPAIGGITSHIVELSRTLMEQGHSVEVWAYLDGTEPGAIHNIPAKAIRSEPVVGKSSWALSRSLRAGLEELAAAFAPDVIHGHTIAMGISCQNLRSDRWRTVFTNHSSAYLERHASASGRFKNWLSCRQFDGLLAPSRELLEASRGLGYPPGRREYIPNGVDVDVFCPGDSLAARRALGLPEDRFIVLSTRRFVAKNGVRYLADALPRLCQSRPDMLCVFCGNTPESEETGYVQSVVERHHLHGHVRLEGAVPNRSILTYLRSSDVVILPSLVEATSISGLEAMAVGKPLVGTRVGGIPDLIQDGRTGRLVPPRDPRAIATAVEDLCCDRIKRDTWGRAAREFAVASYSWPVIAERTVEFYRRLIHLPQRRFGWRRLCGGHRG